MLSGHSSSNWKKNVDSSSLNALKSCSKTSKFQKNLLKNSTPSNHARPWLLSSTWRCSRRVIGPRTARSQSPSSSLYPKKLLTLWPRSLSSTSLSLIMVDNYTGNSVWDLLNFAATSTNDTSSWLPHIKCSFWCSLIVIRTWLTLRFCNWPRSLSRISNSTWFLWSSASCWSRHQLCTLSQLRIQCVWMPTTRALYSETRFQSW